MRKTKLYTVPPGNRDEGKTFLITELPATQGEKWAARALSSLARNGVDLGPDIMQGGMAAFAVIGLNAFMRVPFDEMEPLLDEMFTCIRLVPDPGKNPEFSRPLVESDTEEVLTIAMLRDEVLELHTGFSLAAILSSLGAAARSQTKSPPSTRTSQELSD